MIKLLETKVPNEILTLIGDITVSFAILESLVKDQVDSLLGAEERLAQTITARLKLWEACELVLLLYLERYGEDEAYKNLKNLIQSVKKVSKERNDIIHSIWKPGQTANIASRIAVTSKSNRGVQVEIKDISKKKLTDTLLEIKALTFMFMIDFVKLKEEDKLEKASNIL